MQYKNPEQLTEELELMMQRIVTLDAENQGLRKSLDRAERKYADLFENAGDSIFMIDPENLRIVDCNGHAARRLGYQRDELLQLTLDDIEVLNHNDVADQEISWESSFSQTRIYECRYKRKDGSHVAVEVSCRWVTVDGVRLLQNFVRDNTHRKELEAARHRAEAEVLRLATVIHQASESIFITDFEGNIIYANPHCEITTGYRAEELLGQNPRLFKSHEQDETFYRDLWNTILSGETWHGMFTNRRKNGDLYYEESTIFPIRNQEQTITHFAAVKRDITDRILTEKEREQLIYELNAFAETVAHDLKSPLMLVRGYSGLLLDDLTNPNDPEVVEKLNIKDTVLKIDRGAAKMNSIIEELLLLASTRQSADVQKSPLDMVAIAKEAIIRFQLMIEERHAEITFLNPEAWPVALGYRAWIEEVMANYISNAIKYGSDVPRVELGAVLEDNDMVRFWVKDNGQGIPLEKQAELFKPFSRLGERRIQGNGLGLSIVQRIVNKLGGKVGVESVIGQGSIFSFTLPLSR
jgi:PAS domain S-box-containing protein